MSRNKNLNSTNVIVQGKPEGTRRKGRTRTAVHGQHNMTNHGDLQATLGQDGGRETVAVKQATRAANVHPDDAG